MRHKPVRLLILLLLLAAGGSLLALAAYTPNGRELVSLRYLEDTFLPRAVSAGEAAYDARESGVLAQAGAALEDLDADHRFYLDAADGNLTVCDAWTDFRCKKGDVVTVGTGTGFLLLAGGADVSPSSGAVVDVTDGLEVPDGTALLPQHRYLAAEKTVAAVTVTSDTAVLSVEGSYILSPSKSTDYNMLADAMKAMGLFRGSDTGYGSGYDLEKVPTRIQGLIMFLRLIGEEHSALATSAPCPFSDVPAWCRPYVAYAYEKGYTKGISQTEFGPSLELRSTEYLTFVLRALGYSDSGENADFAWDTALFRALQLGVLTAREHKMLTEQPFLRAQVVYVSYYALDARLKTTGKSLYATLTAAGVLDDAVAGPARAAVTSVRMR